MGSLVSIKNSRWFDNPLIRKCPALVSEDLSAIYSRDIRKWLLVDIDIGARTVGTVPVWALSKVPV